MWNVLCYIFLWNERNTFDKTISENRTHHAAMALLVKFIRQTKCFSFDCAMLWSEILCLIGRNSRKTWNRNMSTHFIAATSTSLSVIFHLARTHVLEKSLMSKLKTSDRHAIRMRFTIEYTSPKWREFPENRTRGKFHLKRRDFVESCIGWDFNWKLILFNALWDHLSRHNVAWHHLNVDEILCIAHLSISRHFCHSMNQFSCIGQALRMSIWKSSFVVFVTKEASQCLALVSTIYCFNAYCIMQMKFTSNK